MVRPVNGMKENVYALLKCLFIDYAVQLRTQYPERKIRNAAVLASGIPVFERLGYIELVDARKSIPDHIMPCVAQRIPRARQPIWVRLGKVLPVIIDNGMAARRLRLRWEEHGGPEVEEPRRKGFGSQLVERALYRVKSERAEEWLNRISGEIQEQVSKTIN